MEFETIETERLLLKKITPEIIVRLFADYPEASVREILGLHTDADFLKEKEKSQGGYSTYDRTMLAFLLVRKDTGETIGRGGFHNWYPDHRKAEIGYALANEENKRNGYMTEAVAAMIGYGFRVMDLNRIEACVGPANEASLRIIRKYGFTQEGHLRQHYRRDNDIHDSLVFSLLRHEYETTKTVKQDDPAQLAARFTEVILNGTWIANTNFKHQLERLDWQVATTPVAPLNTIAVLAQHIHYYIAGINKVFDGGTLEIRDQYSFDFAPIGSQRQWEAFLSQFWNDAQAFANHVAHMPEQQLNAVFTDEKYGSYRRNIDAMIEHSYYHLGQIVLIRKMLAERP